MANVCGTWYPPVFPDRCDGCAKFEKPRCIEFCPSGVYEFRDGKAIVAYPYKCVNGCTACEPLCPKKAVSFPERESTFISTAYEDKGLLRKTVCVKCGKSFWTNREVNICMDCDKAR